MLPSLNDTHLGCIAPLLIPQQGSLDQVSVRQGYTETKCVCFPHQCQPSIHEISRWNIC